MEVRGAPQFTWLQGSQVGVAKGARRVDPAGQGVTEISPQLNAIWQDAELHSGRARGFLCPTGDSDLNPLGRRGLLHENLVLVTRRKHQSASPAPEVMHSTRVDQGIRRAQTRVRKP
jgi:hypothetical protein